MTDPQPLTRAEIRRRVRMTLPRSRPHRGRSIWVLLMLLLLWSVCLGVGLAQATEPRQISENLAQAVPPVVPPDSIATNSAIDPSPRNTSLPNPNSLASEVIAPGAIAQSSIGTVDVVSDRYKTGQEVYLQTCATCHFGIPPAVMPSETWRQLLQDPEHYGAELQPLSKLELRLVWEYIRTYSRPLLNQEETPYRIYQSRYFKALHPQVDLPTRAGLGSCISCHPGAGQYDFRSLSAEWQNAP